MQHNIEFWNALDELVNNSETIPCEVACKYNDINISLKKQSPFYWTVKFV